MKEKGTGESMRAKLDFKHHKTILSILLFVMLIIGIIFGGYLANASPDPNALGIMTFSLVFLTFVVSVIGLSMLIRTRDELHEMHEENRQHFHNVHERIKSVHNSVLNVKKR